MILMTFWWQGSLAPTALSGPPHCHKRRRASLPHARSGDQYRTRRGRASRSRRNCAGSTAALETARPAARSRAGPACARAPRPADRRVPGELTSTVFANAQCEELRSRRAHRDALLGASPQPARGGLRSVRPGSYAAAAPFSRRFARRASPPPWKMRPSRRALAAVAAAAAPARGGGGGEGERKGALSPRLASVGAWLMRAARVREPGDGLRASCGTLGLPARPFSLRYVPCVHARRRASGFGDPAPPGRT